MGHMYASHQKGDIVKIEVRDETFRILYRKKFNVSDRNAWWEVIQGIEIFGFSVVDLIKEKMGIGEFF